MLKVESITNFQDFLKLEPIWNKILEQSDADSPFLTFEWISTWWRCFKDEIDSFGYEKSLHILLVKDKDKVIALAPLMTCKKRIAFFPCTIISNIVNWHSFKSSFILIEKKAEALECLLNYFKTFSNWDLIDLYYLPNESDSYLVLMKVLKKNKDYFCYVGEKPFLRSPHLPIETDWETFFASKRSKERNDITRKLRKLRNFKEFKIEKITSFKKGVSPINEIFEIEKNTWQFKNKTSMISKPALKKFYSQIAEIADKKGWLYFFILKINGKPVAFEYNLKYKNIVYNLKIGHDSNFNKLGPGIVLKYFVLKNTFKDGFKEFDFLGSDEEYKKRWTKHVRTHSHIVIFNKNHILPVLLYYSQVIIKPYLKRLKIVQNIKSISNIFKEPHNRKK